MSLKTWANGEVFQASKNWGLLAWWNSNIFRALIYWLTSGSSLATRSLNPSYFNTERKYWKEKNASNYKIMNYKTNHYIINTNSYPSFKVRQPYNPCETDWKHAMFNNVYLLEGRDSTKCSFHLVLLFSERKCHPKNERQKWTNKETGFLLLF